jgi:hypothetical protein
MSAAGYLLREQKTLIAALERDLAAARSRIALLEHDMKTGDYETLYAQTVQELAAAQAENEKLREWQVRKNGEIIDLQGVLLDAEGKIERLMKEAAALREKVALAYGHLWHVNNEPYAPVPIYTPEKAAYEARKILRDTLTSEQRGDAINATRQVWGSARGAAHD